MPKAVTLVDAFPFFNEEIMLSARIAYLGKLNYPIIHFAGEGNFTHSGIAKEYKLEQIVRRNLSLKDNQTFEVLKIDLSEFQGVWDREIATRELILKEVKSRFHPCKIIISDLDEFPSLDQVRKFLQSPDRCEYSFPIKNYFRRVNWRTGNDVSPSNGLFLSSYRESMPNAGRYGDLPNIGTECELGGHFSYLHVSMHALKEKATGTAEIKLFRNQITQSENFINYCDRYKINHLGRITRKGFGLLSVEESLDGMQKVVADFFPKWHDTSSTPNIARRLWAAAKVSVIQHDAPFFRRASDGELAREFSEFYFGFPSQGSYSLINKLWKTKIHRRMIGLIIYQLYCACIEGLRRTFRNKPRNQI